MYFVSTDSTLVCSGSAPLPPPFSLPPHFSSLSTHTPPPPTPTPTPTHTVPEGPQEAAEAGEAAAEGGGEGGAAEGGGPLSGSAGPAECFWR